MCGIAGFSFRSDVELDRSAVARVLLAGIAERGKDATGWASRSPGGPIRVEKSSRRLAELIEEIELAADATETILHVREFTKGRPGINDNNHPIRWGRVVGVHNGHLDNDDELFERYGADRSTPDITVDTEAIMMLTDLLGGADRALGEVQGSAAVAILQDDRPGILTVARRTRRPLVIGRADGVFMFASTRHPLELVERGTGLHFEYEEVGEGVLIEAEQGAEIERREFEFDARYPGKPLPEYPEIAEKRFLISFALAAFGYAA